MARLTDEQRELILADWHTGQYSHSTLGKKYNTSHVTIGKIVKDIEPKHAEKVTAQIAINTELAEASYNEVTAIETIVKEKTKHLQFINNLTLKNLQVMGKKIDEDLTMIDHKAVQDTIDKAAITLKVADRHSPKQDINIQNTNATQNNIQPLTEDEAKNKALSLGVPLSALM